MDDSTKTIELDLARISEQVRDAIHWVGAYPSSKKDISPASLHQELCRRAVMGHVLNLLDSLLACATIQVQGYPTWELGMIAKQISRTAHMLDQLQAEDYAYCVTLYLPPYKECMVHRYRSDQFGVNHIGTGKDKNLGMSGGGDTCRGPLRTEQELMLGMCGSCLNKYGPEIGQPILNTEDLSRIARKKRFNRFTTTPESMKAAILRHGVGVS